MLVVDWTLKDKKKQDIAIFQASKGAAVVVQTKSGYLAEVYKQLNGWDKDGNDAHLHVAHDPTAGFVTKVTEAVNQALDIGTISEEMQSISLYEMPSLVISTLYQIYKNHNVHLLSGLSATLTAQPKQTSLSGLMTS